MSCPYCATSIYFEGEESIVYELEEGQQRDSNVTGIGIYMGFCPSCMGIIIIYKEGKFLEGEHSKLIIDIENEEIIYPKNLNIHVDSAVPTRYNKDFKEAAAVLNISPKASAAISRRLLQNILRDELKIKPSKLVKEIDDFINLKDVPSYLTDSVDAIRKIGNFAAHPSKDTSTGEVLDVEPGEAEWLLEIVEDLFDFVFVRPKKLEKRKKRLNEKLSKIGKPLIDLTKKPETIS
jgi:hypothetical protein